MPRSARRNAVIVGCLAAFFYWAYMFVKHNSYLRNMIPFGDDPYDAVGSFACVVGALLAFVSLLRAFYPYRSGPDQQQYLYLVRSQIAVALAVLITVAADATATARNPPRWFPTYWGYVLAALAAFTTLMALAVLQNLLTSMPPEVKTRRGNLLRAWLVTLGGMLLLALFPKGMLGDVAAHLFAIILGAAVLFASMRLFLLALAPDGSRKARNVEQPTRLRNADLWRRWAGAILLGVLVGVCAFVGEVAEHRAALPMRRLLFIGSVYTGIGLSGIMLAYLFLGEPLGFAPRR